MPNSGYRDFFEQILIDLYISLYLAIGGSAEEESQDWAQRATELASTAIKILILLAVLGALYWFVIYLLKHNRTRLRMNSKRLKIVRATLRYIWIVASFLAVLSQLNVDPDTIKATARASIWAGLYFVAWVSSGHVINRVLHHYGLNASIEQLLRNIFSVLIVVLGLASVLAQFGFDIVSLVAGLGIVGLAVGFAAQSTLANFIAGITILMEQSFQVGDWVRIGDKEGRVVLISLRTTHILTRDNVTIIIPNSTVASAEVTNLTAKNLIRFDMKVRIALEADVAKARELILNEITAADAILNRPAASISVSDINEIGVILIVRFWVSPSAVARIPAIKEALFERIKEALQAAHIAIPYPHMRILMPKDDPDMPDTKPFEIKDIHR